LILLFKEVVFITIEDLIGLNGDSREWRYLNKGTHKEIDPAERVVLANVQDVLDRLCKFSV
jgi:hypothetical protein